MLALGGWFPLHLLEASLLGSPFFFCNWHSVRGKCKGSTRYGHRSVANATSTSASPIATQVVCHRTSKATALRSVPPPPLCMVIACMGTVNFCFANLLRRSDTELHLCVCWLDKVVLLVHCCVLQISCIQGTPPYPVSCRTLQCFTISAFDVDHIDTYPPGAVVNFKPSGPHGLEPTAKPPAQPAPKAAKPRAKPSTKSAAKPAAQVAVKSAPGEPIPVAPVEHVQLFRVKYSRQKKWHTQPVSEQS